MTYRALTLAIIPFFIAACGSDSQSPDTPLETPNYLGFTPDFSVSQLTDEFQLKEINCSEVSQAISDAPQLVEFNTNLATDYIQSIQALIRSLDCSQQQDIYQAPAYAEQISDDKTQIISDIKNGNNRQYQRWQVNSINLSQRELKDPATWAQGLFIDLTPDHSNNKVRIDVLQQANDSGSEKEIRGTIQWPRSLTSGHNIFTFRSTELRDQNGVITEQRFITRILFDNNLSVSSLAIMPGTGAVSYLKKCGGDFSQDEPLRTCNSDWQTLAYNAQGDILSSAADITQVQQLLQSMNLTSLGDSVLDEPQPYFSATEAEYFNPELAQLPLADTPETPETPETPVMVQIINNQFKISWEAITGNNIVYTVSRIDVNNVEQRSTIVGVTDKTAINDNPGPGKYRYSINACQQLNTIISCADPIFSDVAEL